MADARSTHGLTIRRAYAADTVAVERIFSTSSWGLIPATKLSVTPAVERTITADITGRKGTADLSHSVTGYPVFDQREGSWDFYIDTDVWHEKTRENDIGRYSRPVYSHARNVIRKQLDSFYEMQNTYDVSDKSYYNMYVRLDDDPAFYYTGRVWLDDTYSATASHTKITLQYSLAPFKKLYNDPKYDYRWDDIGFEYDLMAAQPWSNISVKAGTTVYVEIPPSDKPARIGVSVNEGFNGGTVKVNFYKKAAYPPFIPNRRDSSHWRIGDIEYKTEGTINQNGLYVDGIYLTYGEAVSTEAVHKYRNYIDTMCRDDKYGRQYEPHATWNTYPTWNTFYLELQNTDSVDHTVVVNYRPEYL